MHFWLILIIFGDSTSTEQENQVNDAPNITEEANDEVSEKPYDVKNSNKVEEEKNESSFSFDQRHTPIDHDDTIPNDWKSAYIDWRDENLSYSNLDG